MYELDLTMSFMHNFCKYQIFFLSKQKHKFFSYVDPLGKDLVNQLTCASFPAGYSLSRKLDACVARWKSSCSTVLWHILAILTLLMSDSVASTNDCKILVSSSLNTFGRGLTVRSNFCFSVHVFRASSNSYEKTIEWLLNNNKNTGTSVYFINCTKNLSCCEQNEPCYIST